MKCPRDKAAMTFTDDGRLMANRCPECSGLFLGSDDVAGALGEGTRAALTPELIGALPPGKLACPRDGAAMRALVRNEVEIDLCAECGSLWLDADEMEKIGSRKPRKGAKKALAAAAVAAAGGAAAVAAADPNVRSSLVGDIASGVGELAVDGVVEVALEFVGDALGSLLDGLF